MQDGTIPVYWIVAKGDNPVYLQHHSIRSWTGTAGNPLEVIEIYLGPELVEIGNIVIYSAENIMDAIINDKYELTVCIFRYILADVSFTANFNIIAIILDARRLCC